MKRSTLLLTALTLLFAGQFVRLLVPSLNWYLRQDLGVGIGQVVLIWYGPFILALAIPLLAMRLEPRSAIWAGGVGIVLCRLFIEQTWTPQLVNVAAAVGGIAFCVGLLPVLYGLALAKGSDGGQKFAAGVLLGLSVDTAVRGLSDTLDLVWIPGGWAMLAVIVLLGAFAYWLWQSTRGPVALAGRKFIGGLPLIGLGCFVFIEWMILQNQGWLVSFTGWPAAAALGWIVLGNIGALLAAGIVVAAPQLRQGRWWVLVPGTTLFLAMVYAARPGWDSAMGCLAGLICAGLLLAVAMGPVEKPAPRGGDIGSSVALWLGMLLFATLITVYGISFAVQLPFPSSALAPVAAGGLTLCALAAAGRSPVEVAPAAPAWAPAILGALLLLAPVSVLLGDAGRAPTKIPAQGYPVRVMTYNIRVGFGTSGRQDIEAIAKVIEDAGTDVVALQEIGRGALIGSSADVLALLSRRLDMPYMVMAAATDPLFGNAILSRYPIVAGGQGTLPRVDATIVRGYAWAEIDLGGGNNLLVLNTHLDSRPPESGSAERVAETNALLETWAGRPRAVVLGDMNATMGSPEINLLLDAGLQDAWAEAGKGERPPIDWIFHTADLAAREAAEIDSPASDHFAVVVTLEPKP
jgi:endonuclease/exonuclease/phosphatase family metal-dependent hydrolase